MNDATTKLEFVCLGLCNDLISSKMKSLKYLDLNFEPYLRTCEYCWYEREMYFYLYFDKLGKREKSISHLETIIIGSKLF